MGIFDAIRSSIGGMLADQWKDIVTCGEFDERTLVTPGIRKHSQDSPGDNHGSEDILSNGSIIYVPENTVAFIFSQDGIEQVITEPGGHLYSNGQASVLAGNGLGKALVSQTMERFGFSGMSPDDKRVAYLNLREIRNLKFGTRGPLVYHDRFYETDLELHAYGLFTIQVNNPELCIRNFIPPNANSYSLEHSKEREQLISELLHSLAAAINTLSTTCRISQLAAHSDKIAKMVSCDNGGVGSWKKRYGLELVSIAFENIELSDESRKLINLFSEKKMGVLAYEGTSQHAADIAAQQLIAQGIRDNGLGDGGGMLFGMNLAGSLRPRNAAWSTPDMHNREANPLSLTEQIETLEKLKSLVDTGLLSQEEFTAKKQEILGL